MKRSYALSAIMLALGVGAAPALGQSAPPPLPQLTAEQSSQVQQRIDAYRRATEARVSLGEITHDEADRLVNWREWQIAEQVAAVAQQPYDSPPPDYYGQVPPDYVPGPRDYVGDAPLYYGPYYRYPAPYYAAPRPSYRYWGPSICAGGFGSHFGGRICF
ncbi:MAG TPA: hypothetical protein VFR50_12530 [Casimicrobiaceae bacterium]|nr:hypothetical protein [Casimicrobiaceae bacterium]